MKRQFLFIQGGGNNGYTVDAELLKSLQRELGTTYDALYPEFKPDESKPDFGWPRQIGEELAKLPANSILVAHSVGASLLLKYLSENKPSKAIAGAFFLATPFWTGDEPWKQGLKLKPDFAQHLPKNVPLYFYHNKDDKEISFDQLDNYRQRLPHATFVEGHSGGHQFSGALAKVADDIKSLH